MTLKSNQKNLSHLNQITNKKISLLTKDKISMIEINGRKSEKRLKNAIAYRHL